MTASAAAAEEADGDDAEDAGAEETPGEPEVAPEGGTADEGLRPADCLDAVQAPKQWARAAAVLAGLVRKQGKRESDSQYEQEIAAELTAGPGPLIRKRDGCHAWHPKFFTPEDPRHSWTWDRCWQVAVMLLGSEQAVRDYVEGKQEQAKEAPVGKRPCSATNCLRSRGGYFRDFNHIGTWRPRQCLPP